MRKKMKVWLWAATCLVLIGCIIWGGAMCMLKWDFKQLSTVHYETNHHEIEEDFRNITIVTNTADITIALSEDGNCSVSCHEIEKAIHRVDVKDGALVIELVDTRKWYEHLGIGFDSPNITVYLPQGVYGKLSIKTSTGDVTVPKDFSFESIDISASTGDMTVFSSVSETAKIKTTTGKIHVENISAGSLELSVSTGKVAVSDVICTGDISLKVSTGKTKITNVLCHNLMSNGNTGDITLENVMVLEVLHIERSTGDIELESCDSATIFLQTDTGDIEGTLRSEKVFFVQTDTGDVDVPKTATGGKCEIHTDTGDIKIKILH